MKRGLQPPRPTHTKRRQPTTTTLCAPPIDPFERKPTESTCTRRDGGRGGVHAGRTSSQATARRLHAHHSGKVTWEEEEQTRCTCAALACVWDNAPLARLPRNLGRGLSEHQDPQGHQEDLEGHQALPKHIDPLGVKEQGLHSHHENREK